MTKNNKIFVGFLLLLLFFFNKMYSQNEYRTIDQLSEITIENKTQIDSINTFLKGNIPQTEQEIESVFSLFDNIIEEALRSNNYELLSHFINKNRDLFSAMGANLPFINSINAFLENADPKDKNQKKYYAEIIRVKGKIYDHIGLIDQSIKTFNEAMVYADANDIYFTAIHSRIHLAYEYHHHKQSEIPTATMQNLYKESEKICIDQNMESNLPYVYSGLTNKGMGTNEDRELYFQKSINIFLESERLTPYFIQLASYQEFLYENNRILNTHTLDQIISEFNKANIEYRSPYINLLRIKGLVIAKNKNFQQAENVLLEALDEALAKGKQLEIKEVRLALANCYSLFNRAKESEQLRLILELEESVHDQKNHYLSELNRIANQVSQRELLLLEKDKNLRKRRIIQISLSLFTLLTILALLVINHLYKNNKIKSTLLEKNNKSLVSRNNLILQQEAILKEKNLELEAKKTSLDKLNSQLLQSQKLLIESNHNLSQFAHVVAHDLKAPLGNISAFIKLFIKRNSDKVESKNMELLTFVEKSTKSLQNLIMDLLEFAQVNNDLPKKLKNHNFYDILEVSLGNLKSKIEEHGVLVHYESKDVFVIVNESMLFQLLTNLINNAIKFQKKDEALIINIDSKSHNESHYVFSVEDNGIGIEEEQQKEIFKPFKKLHSQDKYEGSGIGLATCVKILEIFDGKIWVESEFGVGTTFYFTIPKGENEMVDV